jgi:hypothetical protein
VLFPYHRLVSDGKTTEQKKKKKKTAWKYSLGAGCALSVGFGSIDHSHRPPPTAHRPTLNNILLVVVMGMSVVDFFAGGSGGDGSC